MSHSSSHRRIHFLDELRGFCVILMVFYHAFYTIGYIFNVPFSQTLFEFFTPAEPFFAGLFIFICGICCNLSHNNLKRGLCLAAVSALLSLVLYLAVKAGFLHSSSLIWFGILQCLAACILLYVLLRPTIRFIPAWIGLSVCAVLFIFCLHVPSSDGGYFGIRGLFILPVPQAPLNNPFLYALGLCPVSLTADYFPLLPWFFCFLGGCYVGTWHRHYPKWMHRRHIPLFSRIGKLSLWIYLAHQPVIYGLCYGIDYLIRQLS